MIVFGGKLTRELDPIFPLYLTPQEYESDLVQNCESLYEFYRLFISDEFIDLVVEQRKVYVIQQGKAGKAEGRSGEMGVSEGS